MIFKNQEYNFSVQTDTVGSCIITVIIIIIVVVIIVITKSMWLWEHHVKKMVRTGE